jgi:Orsellinic acid/F9775 biosynthesis cluster protein D
MFCGSAWAPLTLLGHCKNQHPDMKCDPDAQSKLDELVLEYGIVSEVASPDFNGIPIEGLKEHNDGLICKAPGCSYACRKASVMDKHWSQCHQYSRVPTQDRHRTGMVQCFFTGTGHKYFAVNPSLKDVDPEGLYATFIRDYLPSLPPLPVLPPNTHREVPPLLAHTGWHLHLDSFVTDETKHKALVESALRPLQADKDPLYGQLYDWVFEYLNSIRDIAQHEVPYTLLKYILQYPWYVLPLYLIPHSTHPVSL